MINYTHVHFKKCFSKFPVCFAITYSLDLIIIVECRNDLMAGFELLHLCMKTKNLAFDKKQFSTLVFAFDSKFSKINNLLKSFKIFFPFKMMTQSGACHPKTLASVLKYRTNAKLFQKLFCKMHTDHFLSSQIKITVS